MRLGAARSMAERLVRGAGYRAVLGDGPGVEVLALESDGCDWSGLMDAFPGSDLSPDCQTLHGVLGGHAVRVHLVWPGEF